MNFELNTSLVAFLDILGFKEKLLSVSTEENLKALYNEVKQVHEFFDKDPDSELTQNSQEQSARSISSLSDAVVIALDFDSPLSDYMELLDIIASELSDMAMSQGQCVTQGIFLRGGIDVGYHFLDPTKDIILSDAMAKAYTLEGEACYPIICFNPELYEALINDDGNDCYSEDISPRNSLFATTTHPKTGDEIHFLDYFRICIANLDQWYCHDDLERYRAEQDIDKKQAILNESYMNNILAYVSAHKDAIEAELKKELPKPVMKKYLWLADYHNNHVDGFEFGNKYKIAQPAG
ncbi:hypothetical protein P4C99_21315 [Pontiellaceae bacterium B1224]|nr:hypothetical protein [Pontiellaceae bacterium B1224]